MPEADTLQADAVEGLSGRRVVAGAGVSPGLTYISQFVGQGEMGPCYHNMTG